MRLKRRQILQGLVATSALLLVAPAHAALPRRRIAADPEPLQHFPGFAEGFYCAGEHVYYVDEHQMGWAPRGIDCTRMTPIALANESLGAVLTMLRKRHWAWTVEHAVLLRLDSEPALAALLLTAALGFDRAAPHPSAARLHHLKRALGDPSRTRPWRSTTTDGKAFSTALRGAGKNTRFGSVF